MDRFKPLRSSPPYKPNKLPIETSDAPSASSVDTLAVELRQLSQEDVDLLETVVQRAGPSATTFLTVFKAYSEVLTDRGLDPQEVVYYSKLLKLGTMKGRNWGEKWERVKSEWQKTQTKKPPPRMTKPESVHFDADTVSILSTSTDRPLPPTSRVGAPSAHTKESISKRPARPTKPISRITEINDESLVKPLRHASTNPSHRKRAVSPISKPKEEQARDIVARAKGRKGAALNDAGAWKNIQMQHDEENADLFRQDKLVERCWQIWQQGYRWIVTTTEQIGEARNQLIVQRSLEKWKAKFTAHQQLYKHINDLSNRRVLLTFLQHWQTKTVEARQKKWRQDMRNKMKIVRQNHESGLAKDVWFRWRHRAQARLAYQGYLGRLIARAYFGWKEKMFKIAELNTTADEVYQNSRGATAVTFWRKWRRAVEYRSAETTMRRRVNLGILDDAFRKWRQHLHAYVIAERFFEQRLKAKFTKRWSRRLMQVHSLEKRADRQLANSDSLLLYAIIRIWKARKNGHLLEQERSKRIKLLALRQWKEKIDSHRADQQLADKFSARPGSSLVVTAVDQWKRAFLQIQSGQQLADAFHMSHLAIVSIHQWRKHLRKKMKMVKIARAAALYFQMRRAWFRWVEKVEAKRRDRLLDMYVLNLKKKQFEVWLNKARTERARNLAVQEMHDRISHRTLREALSRWTDRVIALKSRELDTVQQYNMVLLATAFQKLRTRHQQHVEAQNLLESFMYLKQKDLLRRSFYRWLTAARLSNHRRVVLQEKEDEIRLRSLEAIWDKWREKSLRPREDEILLQCQRNILCRVLSKWHGMTKAPPAIRFDSLRVKNHFFKQWKDALSQVNRGKVASSMDRQWVAAKFFERWLIAYRAKKTLKAVARARHLRLPTASTKRAIQTNAFPRRSDFIRPQTSSRDRGDDLESDEGSVRSSVAPPVRAPSVTSSTYIGGKSRAPSVMSSASRYVFPKPRETSPTRAVPSSISRARSDTRGSSPPPLKRGPSSVASEDVPRRAWPGLQRGTRPFFQPN